MTRITSLLTIALAIAFGLTLGAPSAAAGHSRSNCETRIFQGEDQACFESNLGLLSFQKEAVAPALATEEQAGGFTVNGADCGCQLRRKTDLICSGDGEAVIGSFDSRGKRIWGEVLAGGEQTKLIAKRVGVVICIEDQ